jgi:class 3 adenylate cyclase/tetratricopeptide (TPR) repeat protein
MKCQNCSFDNSTGAKYCQNCGHALEITCPNCGTLNPASARFCMNCGYQVRAEAAAPAAGPSVIDGRDPRLARLAAAAPAGLAAKMQAAAHLTGGRRLVTALFADVVGSTSVAEGLDPEDWTTIMNRAFDRLVPVIYHYEGTIARLMGDALLVFFGAPVAHEDDPVRAVRAGLDLLEAARAYSDEVRSRYGFDFAIRVGLNSGPVVVGEVGSDLVYEYTAMGDAVNLAARMQAAARPMTVLIAENTYRFVAPLFEFNDLGAIKVKGKQEPVRAYEVTGVKERPGSLRGLTGLSSPMVGRAGELEKLAALCDVLRAGMGGCALIIGEAGMGKSRLLQEWKAYILEQVERQADGGHAVRAVTWAEGRTLSYGQGLPYHLLADLLNALLDLPDHAPAAENYAALVERADDLCGPAAVEIYPYLAHLLGLPLQKQGEELLHNLDPQALQNKYLSALELLISALAARQPLILVCEDLHWADASSTDLLIKLLPLAKRLPVLFAWVTRPDRDSSGWALVAAARAELGDGLAEILLNPLTGADTQQLISNLLEVDALPEAVRSAILNKAEGNPLFVEEVLRMLIDQGAIIREPTGWTAVRPIASMDIPGSLQSLLLARIDRLPETVKTTLRVASVIGRQFSVHILNPVLERVGSVDHQQHLEVLESAGLVYRAQTNPEIVYLFRHSLVQEAAYDSLLKVDRQRLHQATAQTLETVYAEQLDELSPLLAHHFQAAGELERALVYHIRAADRALERYALPESNDHYSRAIVLAEASSLSGPERARLYLQRGRALELATRYQAALENYMDMKTAAIQSQDEPMHLEAITALATLYAIPTEFQNIDKVEELSGQALGLAAELGEPTAEVRILQALSLLYGRINLHQLAVEYGEQAVGIARGLGDPQLLAFSLHELGHPYLGIREFRRGRATMQEAGSIFRQLGNLPMLADNLSTTILYDFFLGDHDQALQSYREAARISEEIRNLWGQSYARMYVGYIFLDRGEPGTAIQVMQDCIALAEKSGFLIPQSYTRADLGLTYAWLGAFERSEICYARAIEVGRRYTPGWLPWVFSSASRASTMKGDFDQARRYLEEARLALQMIDSPGVPSLQYPAAQAELALATGRFEELLNQAENFDRLRQVGLRAYLPYILYGKGVAHFGLQRLDEALQFLEQARTEAAAMGSRRYLWTILALLARIHCQRGELEQASALQDEARQIIQGIAANLSQADLRDSFLSLPEVRAVIEAD